MIFGLKLRERTSRASFACRNFHFVSRSCGGALREIVWSREFRVTAAEVQFVCLLLLYLNVAQFQAELRECANALRVLLAY